jgi:hypothetical protein
VPPHGHRRNHASTRDAEQRHTNARMGTASADPSSRHDLFLPEKVDVYMCPLCCNTSSAPAAVRDRGKNVFSQKRSGQLAEPHREVAVLSRVRSGRRLMLTLLTEGNG